MFCFICICIIKLYRILKRSDVALCGLTRTWHRLQILDYSIYTDMNEWSFWMLSPGYVSRTWIFARPFNYQIWTPIIIAFVLIALLLVYSSVPLLISSTTVIRESKDSVQKILLQLYGICINQGKFYIVY